MLYKSLPVFLIAGLISLILINHVAGRPSGSALENTIQNMSIDMQAGSFHTYLLSENIGLHDITKIVIVGDKYSHSQGKSVAIENKERIVQIWNTYFRNAKSYNCYYGEGSRRLDIYTVQYADKPAMTLLIDPTDLTSPVNRVDRGFRCPGLEKWIRSELNKQKS